MRFLSVAPADNQAESSTNMTNADSIIDQLQSNLNSYRAVIDGLPTAALRWHPEKEWSIAAIITHMGMNEVFVGERLRHIATGQEPMITLFVMDERIPAGGNPGQSIEQQLQQWQTLRFQLCSWLATLSPQHWELRAGHPQRGWTTLHYEVDLHVKHDAEHLQQALDVRQAWEARNGSSKKTS